MSFLLFRYARTYVLRFSTFIALKRALVVAGVISCLDHDQEDQEWHARAQTLDQTCFHGSLLLVIANVCNVLTFFWRSQQLTFSGTCAIWGQSAAEWGPKLPSRMWGRSAAEWGPTLSSQRLPGAERPPEGFEFCAHHVRAGGFKVRPFTPPSAVCVLLLPVRETAMS